MHVWVSKLHTDQTVSSSVMNARVVTVSGVTWTFFTASHAFRCGGEEGWDHYRLGHPAAEVLADSPPLNVQSGHSKVLADVPMWCPDERRGIHSH